jgi:hypothetical protein
MLPDQKLGVDMQIILWVLGVPLVVVVLLMLTHVICPNSVRRRLELLASVGVEQSCQTRPEPRRRAQWAADVASPHRIAQELGVDRRTARP